MPERGTDAGKAGGYVRRFLRLQRSCWTRGGSEEAVTLRAVARRAGIATPSIYAHFADRQSILLAIVQDAFAELSHRLAKSATAADPAVRLHAVCAAYLDFAATSPQRSRVMFAGVWSAAQALDDKAIH